MSVHSRYRNNAKHLEVKTDAKRPAQLRDAELPQNRKQRRALLSAAKSKRKLLIARRSGG